MLFFKPSPTGRTNWRASNSDRRKVGTEAVFVVVASAAAAAAGAARHDGALRIQSDDIQVRGGARGRGGGGRPPLSVCAANGQWHGDTEERTRGGGGGRGRLEKKMQKEKKM